MADWSKRFDASYRFMRVSRSTGLETGLIGGIRTGGSITRNLDTDIKESGSIDCVGSFDVGPDLVRVYLDAAFPHDGSTESVALGTFLPSVSSRTTDGTSSGSTVSLNGRLKELADSQFVQPFMLPAGTNLVEYATTIARGAGLAVNADDSAYTNSEPLYYGVQPTGTEASSDDSTKLAVVNDLLERAGFDSARTDPMGNVLMKRTAAITDRAPAWSFIEGATARFLRDATDEADTSSVANVVYVVYSGQAEDGSTSTTIGSAVDDDPASPWSTVSMGREVVARYDYQGTATQAEADAKAAELLAGQRSVARKVTMSHVYAPVSLSDAVAVDYRSGGITGTFGIRTQRLTLGAGCLTETEARAYGSY